MTTRGLALVGALAACSPTPLSAPRQDIAPADDSAGARAAIAAATLCAQTTDVDRSNGFSVAVEEATARRDPSDGARWIVTFPPGHYMGRLPPPGPGRPLLLTVEPTKSGQCTPVSPTPLAP